MIYFIFQSDLHAYKNGAKYFFLQCAKMREESKFPSRIQIDLLKYQNNTL